MREDHRGESGDGGGGGGKGGGGRVDLKKFKEENKMTQKDIKEKKCHKFAED